MEEKVDYSSAFSWWSDSHNRLHQSQWLQSALSDLDKKTRLIVNLIQDDGDSFAKRAEVFYMRRPELIKILQELHTSYRSLAEKYDKLRSECIHVAHLKSLKSPLLNVSKQVHLLQNSNQEDLEEEQEHHYSPKKPCESVSSEPSSKNSNSDVDNEEEGEEKIISAAELNGDHIGCALRMDSREEERMRSELRQNVSKLIEDNLQQQAELVRRNDEKREVIKQLRSQINRLMEENRTLKSYLPSYKGDVKRSQSRVSKLKGLNCIGKLQG